MNRLVRNIVYEEDGLLRFWSTDAQSPQPDSVYLERFADKNPIMIDGSDIPGDPEYNLSWELSNGEIVINMDKAKEIHRDFLRKDRVAAFKEVDEIYMAASSQDKDLTLIKARQTALRDITANPAIDVAQTIAELKAIGIPTWTPPTISSLPAA